MAEPKYFDFLDDDDIYKKITEIAYPYEVKEEINLARKKIGEGSYYRAGTVSREILESLIFEGLLKSNQLSNVEKDNIKAENLSKKINNLRNRNLDYVHIIV